MQELEEEQLLSMINTESIKNCYKAIEPSHWELSDIDLVSLLKPTKMDWRIRIRFWDLVGKVLGDNDYDIIYAVDIHRDICGTPYFRSRLKKQYYGAFLFRPIEKFTDEVETMLAVTRGKMWHLINAVQPVKEDGTVDYAQSNLLMKLHNQLVDRKLGAVRQLVEMKKIQLNVNASSTFSDDVELLDTKIRELRPHVDSIKKSGDGKT